MTITRTIATALFATLCTLSAFWAPAHADEIVATGDNTTVTVTVVTYTMVIPSDQLSIFRPVPTAAPVQEAARPQFIVATATPEPGLWEKLAQPHDERYEPQRNVGLNRLGTVAVLLGICILIVLLASAIVRVLRGK